LKFELSPDSDDLFPFITPFEVTLDSLQILPHWEVLDARTDADERQTPQEGMGETLDEQRFRKQKEASRQLIEEETLKGFTRKQEREKKELVAQRRKLKRELKQSLNAIASGIEDYDDVDEIKEKLEEVQKKITLLSNDEVEVESNDFKQKNQDNPPEETKQKSFDGPCVIYLSPNEQSCIALKALREELRIRLFPSYDAFSQSSSVSYPEFLPKKSLSDKREGWRPLLPIARFPSVKEAVKVAKVLQKSWHPLEFNVTDIQFISRSEDDIDSGNGLGASRNQDHATQSMAVTTSGEVDDVTKVGVFGCDAMVMLLGEEPEEEIIEDDATLSMIVAEGEDESNQDGNIGINYNALFTNAEREYQRMKSHEELSSAEFLGEVPIFSGGDDLEKWLDDDDNELDDEGATVVLGRAQFFMGAMREFVG
jgi:hypothetical protein